MRTTAWPWSAAITRVTLTLIATILLAAPARADEWNRFRGPNGSGIADAPKLPVTWTDKDYLWTAALPGTGHSSPVVWKDKLFITAADNKAQKRFVLCYRTTDGQLIWSRPADFETEKKHQRNSYASGTPAVDDLHVYAIWQSRKGAELLAFDHQGEPAWKFDLGPYQSGHGCGTSPIVVDELVVLNNNQEGDSFLLAVDRRTGAERWRVKRKKDKATYSTPCVFTNGAGQKELIFTSFTHGFTSVSPATGTINWEKTDVFEKDGEDKRSIGSPIVAGDLVLGNCGFAGGKKIMVALRPVPGGAEEVFRHDKTVNHMPTALAYNGLLFMWADNGVVTCASLKDGKQVWQKRVGGSYSGSPVCVNGRLYAISDDGDVVVIAASETFAELGKVALGESSSSTPAVSGGTMFLRTTSKLFALGGK